MSFSKRPAGRTGAKATPMQVSRYLALACIFLAAAFEPPASAADRSNTLDSVGAPEDLGVAAGIGSEPEAPVNTPFPVRVEATVTVDYELEEDYGLDESSDDNQSKLEPEFALDISFAPHPRVQGFVNLELSRRFVLEERGEIRNPETSLKVKEAYLTIDDVLVDGLSMQLGRQEFKDRREWIYDEELDGIRLYFRRDAVGVEMSATREELIDKDLLNKSDPRMIINYVVLGRFEPTERTELNGYLIVRDDRTSRRQDRVFLGLSSFGGLTPRLTHWVDAAVQWGSNGSSDLEGVGFDVGATYRLTSLPWRLLSDGGFCLRLR